MATEEADQSYLELYDVEKKEKVASAPLAGIRFLPRTGERIFIPVKGPGDWKSYTVVAVEYFIGEMATGEPSPKSGRVTLYAEPSR
jgi:hypothetical protein